MTIRTGGAGGAAPAEDLEEFEAIVLNNLKVDVEQNHLTPHNK
jgi:hypothetical protein